MYYIKLFLESDYNNTKCIVAATMGRSRKTARNAKKSDPHSWEKSTRDSLDRQCRKQRRKGQAGLANSSRSQPCSLSKALKKSALFYGLVLYLKAPKTPDENASKKDRERYKKTVKRYKKRKEVELKSILETLKLMKGKETFMIAANMSLPSDIETEIKNKCAGYRINLEIYKSANDVIDPGRQRALLAKEMLKHDRYALYVISDARRVLREPGLEGKKQNPREIRKQLFNEHKYGMLGSPQSWRSKNASGVPLQTFIFDSSFLESYPNFFKPGYLFEEYASLLFEYYASLLEVPIYINGRLKRYTYTAPSLLRQKGTPFPSVWNNKGAMRDIIENVLLLIRSGKLVVKNGNALFAFPTCTMPFDGSFRLHMLVLVACHYAGIFADIEFDLALPERLDEINFARKASSVWNVLRKKGPMSKKNFTQKEVCKAIKDVTELIIRESRDRIVNSVGQYAIPEFSSAAAHMSVC